jgi:hypothetical protein
MKLTYKLQQGGGMPAFVSYTNVPQPQVAAPYSSTSSSQGEPDGSVGLLDKNMVKFLYENGIPSDVEAFVETSDIFSDSIYKNPFSNNATVQYKTILKMLPRIKAENERFKNAMTQADKNGGLGEIAVTDGGHVITVDAEGKLQKKSLNDVDLNSEQILTNSELANYRANSINAAFNTDLTSIIGNAVGIPKITEYIQSVVNKLGTTSMSREGYVGQQSGRILKGMEYLAALQPSREDLSGMSVDGLYKMSSMDKSQQAQANQALGYLLTSLPKNMRTVLQAKAAMYLGDNSAEGVKKLLMSLTQSALSGEHTLKLDLQEKMDASGKAKTSGSGRDNNITDPAKAFLLGLGEIKNHKINNGNSYSLNLPGNSAPLVDTSGKTIGSATLEDAARSTFSGVLDFKNATMGGQLLNSSQRSRVAIDGSNVVAVDLPVDTQALQSGVLKPDIDSLKRLELAENEIREGDIKDEAQKNEIYAKYKLPYKYINGQINTNAYGRFAVLDASADESAFVEDPTMDDTLSEVTDINERESIERILKAADASFKMSQPGIFSSGNNVYSGSVYIPVRQNLINASLGSGHYPTIQGNDAMDIEAKEQQKQRLQTYVPSPSLSTL